MSRAIVCELCGSNDLVKQDGLYVCQHCRTKYSPEEAKKMMVEIAGGTVKIDTSDELKNLYELARRAKEADNTEKAQEYYEQIVVKNPTDWEASFYAIYFQAKNCKIGEIGLAASRLTNSMKSILELIKNSDMSETEKKEAVIELTNQTICLSQMLFDVYKNFYDDIDIQIRDKYVQDYANNCSLCRELLYVTGNEIIDVFGDEYCNCAIPLWKQGIKQHNKLNGVFVDKSGNAAVIEEYNEKIKKYDPSYQAPATNMKSDSGCYVATAVYGSYDCPQVWTLRRFRDYKLAETAFGRLFIRTYYAISPTVVRLFGDTKPFKVFWKQVLDPFVDKLRAEGFKDTPYNDKQWLI